MSTRTRVHLSNGSFYGSGAWKQLRKAVLARDPVCRTPGCGRPSSHADHVVPRSAGGEDVLSNLRGLCQSCHNRRSASGNSPLRSIGCLPDGTPRDPAHPFLVGSDPTGAASRLSLGPAHRWGDRISTKFRGQ